MPYLHFAIFFSSSLTTLSLIFFHLDIGGLQKIVAILLVVLILLSRILTATIQKNRFVAPASLYLSSLFVQVLILSTGGFFSPFLILIHIYTLAVSFLLNLPASLVFLFFSLGVMIASIRLDARMLNLFNEDPWSVALYFVSFVVIIPIAQLLAHSYRLKDTMSKLLSEHIRIGELREQSILRGLSELVIVTDKDLNILSVNEAVEKTLNLSRDQILHQQLLQVIPLRDAVNASATVQALSINTALEDRATHIVSGFYLQTNQDSRPISVTIQVRPIVNLEGLVNQVAFVITDAKKMSGEKQHSFLDQAQKRRQALVEELKQKLQASYLPDLRQGVEIFNRVEDDIITALEIEDHPIVELINFQDVARICQEVVDKEQPEASSFNVTLEFSLPKEEVSELAILNLEETSLPTSALPVSDFAVPIDAKWFTLMISKVLELSILVASGAQNRSVQLTLARSEENVTVHIFSSAPKLEPDEWADLFRAYYGNLVSKTNLKSGSGLEGFIAKTLSDQLFIPIEVKCEDIPPRLTFSLVLSREPRMP